VIARRFRDGKRAGVLRTDAACFSGTWVRGDGTHRKRYCAHLQPKLVSQRKAMGWRRCDSPSEKPSLWSRVGCSGGGTRRSWMGGARIVSLDVARRLFLSGGDYSHQEIWKSDSSFPPSLPPFIFPSLSLFFFLASSTLLHSHSFFPLSPRMGSRRTDSRRGRETNVDAWSWYRHGRRIAFVLSSYIAGWDDERFPLLISNSGRSGTEPRSFTAHAWFGTCLESR